MSQGLTDEDVRRHMERCPDHEIIVDEEDQWRCLTCESDEHREVWGE